MSDKQPVFEPRNLGPALRFCAKAVVAQLRSGERPTADEARAMYQQDLMDALRRAVSAADLPWLIGGIEEDAGDVGGFLLGLLRPFSLDPRVKALLRRQWGVAPPERRYRVMWRLLDDESLEPAWHETLREWCLSDWAVFLEGSREFLAPLEGARNRVLSRLEDPGFPRTKRWAYLALAAAADDLGVPGVRALLDRAEEDPFTEECRLQLLRRRS